MYTPQKFKIADRDKAFDLMTKYPFATIISVFGDTPTISQLPLTPIRKGDQIQLIGHMAKANPHWKVMSQKKITAIFHGPHTYVTPMWYAENDVPTWNYANVHISGTVDLIEDTDGLIDCLKLLSKHSEKQWPSGWEFFIPDDLAGEILPRSIVGFKITIEDLNFKMKMSQNRSEKDRSGIMKGLSQRKDEQSHLVLKIMEDLYNSNN